jgi:hypothetical protein
MLYPVKVPRSPWFAGLVDDNGTGNGTVWNRSQIDQQLTAIDQGVDQLNILGHWYEIAPIYGNFFFGAGSKVMWTIIGRTVLLTMNFTGCTVANGAGNLLYFSLPNAGWQLDTTMDVRSPLAYAVNGGLVQAMVQNGQALAVYITKTDTSVWTQVTNGLYLIGTLISPILPPSLADKEAETP